MGKKHLEARIEQAILQAKNFFERNLISIKTHAGEQHYGFPVAEGKKRITEWGATSAGLRALSWLGASSPAARSKCESAKQWLLRQQQNGAWEASGLFSVEATAGVLGDLLSAGVINEKVVGRALEFINSCYRKGYYASTPTSTEKPHIYTTYLAVRCLTAYGRLEKKDEIKNWILESQVSSGMWGRGPGANIDSLVHTIYAYQILHLCGVNKDELTATYGDTIRTTLKKSMEIGYVYEEIEVEQQDSDLAGTKYHKLRIQHFALPALGNLCLAVGDRYIAFSTARKLLGQQFAGGWGPSNDELTMWATTQALEYLHSFKTKILPYLSRVDYLLYWMDLIPYRLAKLCFSLIGLVVFIIFLLTPYYRPNLLVGVFLMIVPWLLARTK